MFAYKYDDNFYYAGQQECQLDPLGSKKQGHSVYLLPANCTWQDPLTEKEGYRVKWNGEAWEYEEIPVEPEPEPPTQEEINAMEVERLKAELSATDYKCLKYVDGALSDEEYAEVKEFRAELRARINELEGAE